MEKLTHKLPTIRVDEATRKTWDEIATFQRRKLVSLMQIIAEDVAKMYKDTNTVFSYEHKNNTTNSHIP